MPDVIANRTFALKDVLLKLGVSQRKLARALNKPQVWLSRIHAGKHLPSWDTACRIAEVLGVSVGVFADQDPAWCQFFTSVAPDQASSPAAPTRAPARNGKKKGR